MHTRLRRAAQKSRPPGAWGRAAGGFLPGLGLLGALLCRQAEGLGRRALGGQVDFFPLSPSPPVCRGGGRVCVLACPLDFSYWSFGQGEAGRGSAVGGFKQSSVQARHSCCGVATFLVEARPQSLGGADRISLLPSLSLPQAQADLSGHLSSQHQDVLARGGSPRGTLRGGGCPSGGQPLEAACIQIVQGSEPLGEQE